MAARRNGLFEYGTIYDIIDLSTNQLGEPVGRLVVDPDTNTFWQQTPGLPAKRLSDDTVKTLIARDAIEFDHDDSRERLINFLIKQEERERAIRERQLADHRKRQTTEALNTETKLLKKTRRNSRVARLTWTAGCFVMAGLAVVMSIPAPEPAPAVASIAGEGTALDVDQDLLTDASYMTVLGNGATVYGVVMDNEIVESGQSNANESTVKENVMVNPSVSGTYPLHMRPLYYDRATYHQSMLRLNDSNGGSSAIYLQNPGGYLTGVPANEIVLVGGQGLASVVLSSPTATEGDDADDTAREIEEQQRAQERGEAYSEGDEDTYAGDMPDGWCGYDYADIDANMVAASYYYTKNNTGRSEDLRRRVVLHNISSVYNEGSEGVGDITSVQMNYQDLDGNYYDPVVSNSPASNGAVHWVGYMHANWDGNDAKFSVRRYETAQDILQQSDANTYSTNDITGNDFPITNYTLDGDLLFFEQQGAIWVSDLSKISVKMEGTQRVVSRTNPVKICSASDVRSSVSSDDAFIATALHKTQVPTADYQVMRITTSEGVEYGIAYIDAKSGDLVFKPCNNITVAASSGDRENADENVSETDSNSNANATGNASDGGADEDAASGNAGEGEQQASGDDQSAQTQQEQGSDQQAQTQQPQSDGQSGEPGGVQQEGASDGNTPAQVQTSGGGDAASVKTAAYEVSETQPRIRQVADEGEEGESAGTILIRPASEESRIVCYAVRGEQLYWIEESTADGTRSLKVSPVYYRNDAQQAIQSGEAAAEAATVTAEDNAPETTGEADARAQQQADEERRREEQARADAAKKQKEEEAAKQAEEAPAQEEQPPAEEQQPEPEPEPDPGPPTTFTDAE